MSIEHWTLFFSCYRKYSGKRDWQAWEENKRVDTLVWFSVLNWNGHNKNHTTNSRTEFKWQMRNMKSVIVSVCVAFIVSSQSLSLNFDSFSFSFNFILILSPSPSPSLSLGLGLSLFMAHLVQLSSVHSSTKLTAQLYSAQFPFNPNLASVWLTIRDFEWTQIIVCSFISFGFFILLNLNWKYLNNWTELNWMELNESRMSKVKCFRFIMETEKIFKV